MKDNQHSCPHDYRTIKRLEYRIRNLESAFNELSEFLSNFHEEYVRFKRNSMDEHEELLKDVFAQGRKIEAEIKKMIERDCNAKEEREA